jgi:hypothetical protein
VKLLKTDSGERGAIESESGEEENTRARESGNAGSDLFYFYFSFLG